MSSTGPAGKACANETGTDKDWAWSPWSFLNLESTKKARRYMDWRGVFSFYFYIHEDGEWVTSCRLFAKLL
jgi:hypothetical protein